jgi:hypothetical protein
MPLRKTPPWSWQLNNSLPSSIKLIAARGVYLLHKSIHMKRIMISLFALTFLAGSASAQEKAKMKGRHHHRHHGEMMVKKLGLSEDQQKQAKAFREDFGKKMKELNKNEKITVKEMRDKKYALRKELRSKMDGLLTTEQKNKMAQFKAEHQAKSEEHFNKHLDKMKSELALTNAQVEQMRTQRETMQAKMKALRENESLSREQKKEQMLALHNEAKEQRKKIFSAEQLKKLEEMKKKRMENNPAK